MLFKNGVSYSFTHVKCIRHSSLLAPLDSFRAAQKNSRLGTNFSPKNSQNAHKGLGRSTYTAKEDTCNSSADYPSMVSCCCKNVIEISDHSHRIHRISTSRYIFYLWWMVIFTFSLSLNLKLFSFVGPRWWNRILISVHSVGTVSDHFDPTSKMLVITWLTNTVLNRETHMTTKYSEIKACLSGK